MPSKPMLTKAQRDLLSECIEDPGGMIGVVHQYRPAQVLVAKGLAGWLDSDPLTDRLVITPAGRATLEPSHAE